MDQEVLFEKRSFDWQGILRWGLLLAALALAIWTQLRIETFAQATSAGLLFLAAGLLFAFGAPPPQREKGRPAAPLRWEGLRPARIGGGVALILAGVAAFLLWDDRSSRLGLLLWITAVVVLVAALWAARPVSVRQDPIRAWFPVVAYPSRLTIPRPLEILLFVLIVAAALTVRVWDFSIFPNGLQSDEGNNGVEALKWLNGAPYTPYSEANEGQASLFTYLIALGFSLFGPSLEVMRSVSALVGVLTVVAFYFLARDHFSVPAALAGSALLAFSRWHITFSRIVYELILTPLALILLFYFLHKALRDGRPRDFVLAGLALAFGFNTYTAFRTVPIGVAILLLYWLLVRRKEAAAIVGGALLFAASALIGLIPLAIYAIQRPEVIFLRTGNLNIAREIDAVGSWQPLWTNLRNYLLMYNLRGDPVAINNLPGAPALVATVGALALIGLIYALRHAVQPRFFLAVAWILSTLPAGILSVTLESPSSRRVIGMLPLAFFLVSAVVDAFWRSSVRTWHGRLRWLWGGVIAALVVSAGYADVQMFFTQQVTNQSVRMAFSPVESSVARYIAALGGGSAIYLNQNFREHSAIRFIAHNPAYTVLDMALHLPLPAPEEKPVVYILTSDDQQLRFLFEQFYPQGVWEEQRTEWGEPIFNTFTISPEQQAAATGLQAMITQPGLWQNATGPGQRTEGLALPTDFPAASAGVVWSGSLRVPVYGNYTFRVETDGPVSLLIDGAGILAGAGGVLERETLLNSGFHSFSLAADVAAGNPPRLTWGGSVGDGPIPNTAFFTFPAPPFGLTGLYYANPNWEGAPVQVQQDIVIASTDALVSPYSILWTGEIQIDDAGVYRFGTTSDDGSFVYVDGQLAVDNGGQHGASYAEGPPLELGAGRHAIEIRYFQDGGSHKFELYWTSPSTGRRLVPPDRLFAGATGNNPAVLLPVVETPAALPATATAAPPTATPVPVQPSPLQTPEGKTESLSPLPTVKPAAP